MCNACFGRWGAPPCFDLPDRDRDGNWIIRNWTYEPVGAKTPPDSGTRIVAAPPSADTIRHFFAYESSEVGIRFTQVGAVGSTW
jgi:hypothetical protein